MCKYPNIKDASLVGSYPALVKSGGGYVWDDVLEYRVWCHPHNGAADTEDGEDYYYVFETYEDALAFSETNNGTESPLALIVQEEYIDEDAPGQYVHIKQQRLTEWPVEFLSRPKRNPDTIPNFLSPDAPSNRLDILRGLA
ncbi:GCN5 family acetyltransferase [Mucilaginibacter galii]|uniref:GCN5 family acetyltransferase n=1 Tax=Mucilaginibacter galii TaxID=2005073 RepID=A0A917N4U1_9SPHI|nr:GCN5 family acetyltransferase [Mucilaginibacter galii]GGI52507.1 hypothetical protein GCM10011425_37190 [Mucilaginibacter galii]